MSISRFLRKPNLNRVVHRGDVPPMTVEVPGSRFGIFWSVETVTVDYADGDNPDNPRSVVSLLDELNQNMTTLESRTDMSNDAKTWLPAASGAVIGALSAIKLAANEISPTGENSSTNVGFTLASTLVGIFATFLGSLISNQFQKSSLQMHDRAVDSIEALYPWRPPTP